MKQSLLQQENTAFKIQNKRVSLLIQKTKTNQNNRELLATSKHGSRGKSGMNTSRFLTIQIPKKNFLQGKKKKKKQNLHHI